MERIPYLDKDETEIECPACGWSGKGSELKLGAILDIEAEYCCPICGDEVLICLFPTLEEQAADPRTTEGERRTINALQAKRKRFEQQQLRDPAQLPDLDPVPSVILWDFEDRGTLDKHVVLKADERVIWREEAWYDCYERFIQVAAVLQEKYGPGLTDLFPTKASWYYLFGDRMVSVPIVDKARAKLASGERIIPPRD